MGASMAWIKQALLVKHKVAPYRSHIIESKGSRQMFDGKVYWVTGASSGIGDALARTLAKRGARVILSSRNAEALTRVASTCGSTESTLILPFDVADFSVLPSVVERAFNWQGRIDGLINNAGISQRSLAIETAFAVYEEVIGVDLMAPIALTQLVLPHMAKAKDGRIIMISSVAGKVGSPMRTAYSAAKHGLIGYADALRTEVNMLGIEVHVITPGSIKTNVSRNAVAADGSRRGESDPAIENGMDPLLAAQRMLNAVERGDREVIIARGFERAITRMRRLSPNKLFDLMSKIVADGYAQRMKQED
jgi:dehydrogenase/reductase SDR family member 7B